MLVLYTAGNLFGCAHVTKWRSLRMGVWGFLLFFLSSLGLGSSILQGTFLPSLFFLLIWTLPYMWVRGHSSVAEDQELSRVKSQFIAGSAGASLLFLLFSYFSGSPWLYVTGGVIMTYSLASAISYGIYGAVFGSPFHEEDMLPVLLSNGKESGEFIREQLGYGRILKGILALAAGLLFYAAALSYTENPVLSGENLWITGAAGILNLFLFVWYFRESYPFKEWRLAKKSIKETKDDIAAHRENVKNLKLSGEDSRCGTVVLLIGESANRDHMKVFNPAYPAETTPWESEQKGKEGWYFFSHAYSCFTQTTRVLEKLLTGMDQYGRSGREHLVSLIDIAGAAGFKTWWLTNQAESGDLAGYISHTANEFRGTKGRMAPDENLLPLFDEIGTAEKSFVVVHMIGSHIRYEDRYPADFRELDVPGEGKRIRAYDTSVAYTDKILEKIFEKAKNQLKADAVIYLSDHGEDMKYTHGTGRFSFDMTRIPLWVWLSEDYREKYPDTAEILKSHENRIFTNDLTFDLISGLLHAVSRNYKNNKDLSSSAYDLTKETALTMDGTKEIKANFDRVG